MFPFPPIPAPEIGAGLLNRLLRRQSWASAYLRPHAGKIVRFQIAGQAVALRVQEDGLVRAVAVSVPADVVLTLEREQLGEVASLLRAGDPAKLARLMHIEGEAALAQVVQELAQNLRWDPEDELSRVVGDRAAVRFAGLAKGALAGLRQAADRLAGNVAEYVSEEQPILLARASFEDWSANVAALQQRLASVDATLAGVERQIRQPRPC